jgi:hypothetical protein
MCVCYTWTSYLNLTYLERYDLGNGHVVIAVVVGTREVVLVCLL